MVIKLQLHPNLFYINRVISLYLGLSGQGNQKSICIYILFFVMEIQKELYLKGKKHSAMQAMSTNSKMSVSFKQFNLKSKKSIMR